MLTMPVAVFITGTGPPFIGMAGVSTVAVISVGFTCKPLSRSLPKALPTFGLPV